MSKSNIEWTDTTWNPTVGCTKVSACCKHCYAKSMHARLAKMGQAKYAEPFETVWPWPAQLADPLSWRKPRRVFVNSMSDLFHDDLPDEYIAAVFGVMAAAPQHTFQVLTKRAERMREWFTWATERHIAGQAYLHKHKQESAMWSDARGERPPVIQWPLPNVWLGVSTEDQERADERIPHLLATPAAVRFVSYEPALGAVDFSPWLTPHAEPAARTTHHVITPPLSWVIVGGESGPGARPFDVDLAYSTIEQCRDNRVACFVKQLGAHPYAIDGSASARRWMSSGSRVGFMDDCGGIHLDDRKGGDMDEWQEQWRVRQFPTAHHAETSAIGRAKG